MPQKGFGLCGVCLEQIADQPTPPLRHFKGSTMAHKSCLDAKDAYERTDEYKIDQAKAKVETAGLKLLVAQNDLLTARNELARVQQAP